MKSRTTSRRKPLPAPTPSQVGKQLVHKGLVMHFLVQLALSKDSDTALAKRGMGRVHHRILYFAHFAPGITIGELLGMLRVKHQNIQPAMRHLIDEGYIVSGPSPKDGRVRQIACSRKGDRLLEFISAKQRERIELGYQRSTPTEIEGYFALMRNMLDDDDRAWIERLTALADPTEAV